MRVSAKLLSYAAATWLTLGFLGYSVAMQGFLDGSGWVATSAKKQFSGPVGELTARGFGRFTHFRFQVRDSGELALPPELADPLWSGSPDPGASLSDLIREGQEVTVTASGGPFPVVLELERRLPDGKSEKLLDLQDSLSRFTDLRARASRRAAAAEAAGLSLLPALSIVRWWLGRRRARPTA